jgi:hypothetical protein
MSASWLFFIGYGILFLGLFICLALWRKKNRKTRAPFPENAKLLRGPGETLSRKLAELDERFVYEVLIALLIPLFVGISLAQIATHLDGTAQLVGLGIAALALFVTLFFVLRRLVNGIDRWRNTWLGCYGERVVAESLEELKPQGFRIFHDVPAGDAKNPFNIDHVIVGPSGVFAVETKTRRKGRARAGFAEHQIIYDGQVLAYPWGEDRYGLDQAARQAVWLQSWLEQLIGQPVRVQPILTFPGWMVITRARGDVIVLNPKQIPSAVALRGIPALDDRQLDLITRQLDSRCRDVEF